MINLFTLFSLVLALMSLVVSVLCFHRKEQASSILGSASLCASLMTISYLASILLGTDRYMAMSIASSIYLFLHDIVLISLLFYARVYGHLEFSPMERALTFVLIFIAAVDGSWILLNPFMELGVSYVCSSNPTEGYTYIIKPFYHLHLFFSYGISIFTVVLFLVKGFSVPRELRSSYFFLPFSFVVMHATNGLYLAFPQLHEGYNYNITVWLLDIALAFIYYNSFIYSKPHMLMRFKSTLFDSLNQGVMMFDLYNNLILYNDRCDELFTGMKIHHGMKLDYFLTKSGIEKLMQDVGAPNSDNAIVTISYLTEEKEHLPLQCDYRILKNRKNKTLGRYFVFTDITNQMDLMTGYISWDSVLMKTPESDRLPTNVIACDLLGLTNINRTLGQAEGDRMLRNLADTLKQVFIGDYIFVRGQDADLYVLCYGQAESLLHNIMKEVSSLFSQRLQYAISRREESSTVASLMLRAQEGLSFRKLTDIHSNRTSSISSLVRALEECDSDTEAHVRRTQAMGEVLGRHLDIDDVQQSELAILCLLHDIGKIGVPLEILNKPGKLSEEEMIILCSHVDKGYNIARSSSELASLADMIRYHHERWDGT
ncbi:MAG: HD domain-containing protein, partial [Lachnospiraceae bacterium]|nr:HD domain-containing protein [Lachnospiraceae bacterium]